MEDNNVAFGEKPKEIWNSESGKPLPTTNNNNNGRKDSQTSGGEDTQGNGRVSSREHNDSTSVVRRGVDGDLPQRRSERSGDSRVRKGNSANSRATESTRRQSVGVQQLERPQNPKNLRNNHAERGTDYAPHAVNARIEANIKAIETMQQLMESGEQATKEQQAVLRQFSGSLQKHKHSTVEAQ